MIPRLSRSRWLLLASFLLLLASAAECKQGPWTLWNAYASRFIDQQGRVIDPQGGGRTTSEGQSYAMLFSLVNNDRARFDLLLKWTQDNLAGGSLAARLPGWLWGKSKEGDWKLLDSNPASDSDAWIAYSLLEAGRLWKNPTYTSIGHAMLAQIARQEVTELPGFGLMLMPGPIALFSHKGTWTVNPSYLPAFLFQRFAAVDPKGPWNEIAINIPRLLRQGARGGFAMDWLSYGQSAGFSPAPTPGSGQPSNGSAAKSASPPAVGSYDAIRVYLWAGMLDGSGPARSESVNAVPGMGAYLANHGAPPEKVSEQGVPLAQDGPVGFSAAVLPYLHVLPDGEKAAVLQKDRMSTQFDPASGLYGKDPTYYDQNLLLFATGFLDGRLGFGPHGELRVEWK